MAFDDIETHDKILRLEFMQEVTIKQVTDVVSKLAVDTVENSRRFAQHMEREELAFKNQQRSIDKVHKRLDDVIKEITDSFRERDLASAFREEARLKEKVADAKIKLDEELVRAAEISVLKRNVYYLMGIAVGIIGFVEILGDKIFN